ncbi:MAG: glycosyltransferase family 39 protein [Ilumatobacteraceae bacterium]
MTIDNEPPTSELTSGDGVARGDGAPDAGAWRRILQRTGLVYLFSRICVALGAAIVAAELGADLLKQKADFPLAPFADPNYADKVIPKSAFRPILDVLTSWDGAWYLRIVKDGYPRHVQPNVTFNVPDARAAFFPAYPMLVRAVDHVLPGHEVLAALFVNFVLGAIAVLLVGLLARRLFGDAIAEKSMILMALFPGAFVLSFAYSEALLLVVAAGCLLCLMKRQWVAAGVLAAIGTATRPNGLALCAACAVAAFIAIYRHRQWRSLIAPILSPIGFIAFQVWVGIHAGETGIWFRVQREAWKEGTSFGFTALHRSYAAFASPLSSPTNVITAVSVVATVVLLYFLWRYRLPWEQIAYIAGVLVLMLAPSTVTARPRFLYTAFPLLIPAAVYFHRKRNDLWPYVVAACAAGLVGLTGLYGVLGAIP